MVSGCVNEWCVSITVIGFKERPQGVLCTYLAPQVSWNRCLAYPRDVRCAPTCLCPVPSWRAACARSLRRTAAGSRTPSALCPRGWTSRWSLSRCPSRPRTEVGVYAPSAGGSACTSPSPGTIWWTSPIWARGTSSCTPCGSSSSPRCSCSSFGLD